MPPNVEKEVKYLWNVSISYTNITKVTTGYTCLKKYAQKHMIGFQVKTR